MGTSTPSLGSVANQGGELFKGFSALGNKVRCLDFFLIFELSLLINLS